MSAERDLFLKEGIGCYSEAHEILKVFNHEMSERLEQIVKKRTEWDGFERTGSAPESEARGAVSWGRWVCTRFAGSIKKTASAAVLEIGIWWTPCNLDAPVIFYAGVKEGLPEAARFEPPVNPRIKYFTSGHTTWLYIEPEPEVDFDRDFDELLRELLRNVP